MSFLHRRSKYGVRTDAAGIEARTIDGIVFASLREARVYSELKMLEKSGYLTDLRLQVRFPLVTRTPEGKDAVIGLYVADMTYQSVVSKKLVVVDAKGFKTPQYRWKKKHWELQYGMQIEER